jgi:hypothetical protein
MRKIHPVHACLRVKWVIAKVRGNAGEDGVCVRGHEDHALYGPRPWLLLSSSRVRFRDLLYDFVPGFGEETSQFARPVRNNSSPSHGMSRAEDNSTEGF